MVYDTLEDHASPHLTGTVHSEGGGQHFRIVTNAVRIRVLGQAEDTPHGQPDLLRLHGSDDVNSGEVAPISIGLAELSEAEKDSDHDSERRHDLCRHHQANSVKHTAFHGNRLYKIQDFAGWYGIFFPGRRTFRPDKRPRISDRA